MPEALVIGAVAGAVVAAVVVLVRIAVRPVRRDREETAPRTVPGRGLLTLDLDVSGETREPARRLATEAAAPLFRRDETLDQVEVRDRAGALVALVDRSEGLELAERDPFTETTTDRLALPETVRSRLSDDPSLAEVVGAILATAGRDVAVDQDVVRVGDRVVVALESTDPDELSAAFLRYRASGAGSGVVVSRRAVPASEVNRREMLAPDLRYAPPGALQRMADALAVGGDPITFALGPPQVRGR